MSYIRLINYFNLGRLGQVSPDARLPDGLGAGQRSRRHCYSGKVRLAILTRSFLCRLLCSSACPFNSLLSFIRLQADYFKSLLSHFFRRHPDLAPSFMAAAVTCFFRSLGPLAFCFFRSLEPFASAGLLGPSCWFHTLISFLLKVDCGWEISCRARGINAARSWSRQIPWESERVERWERRHDSKVIV